LLFEVLVAFKIFIEVLAPFWIEGLKSKREILFVPAKPGVCVCVCVCVCLMYFSAWKLISIQVTGIDLQGYNCEVLFELVGKSIVLVN
jgi:hypothetical protein